MAWFAQTLESDCIGWHSHTPNAHMHPSELTGVMNTKGGCKGGMKNCMTSERVER